MKNKFFFLFTAIQTYLIGHGPGWKTTTPLYIPRFGGHISNWYRADFFGATQTCGGPWTNGRLHVTKYAVLFAFLFDILIVWVVLYKNKIK